MTIQIQEVTPKEWILAMLYIGNGKIKGKTRLHKGIFIISQEIETVTAPKYEPKDYGPWSLDLENALKELEKDGLIKTRLVEGGDEMPATLIELTDKGWKEAKEIWKKLQKNRDFDKIKLRLEFATKTPLTVLLAYVYGAYHTYTTKSKIKHKVNKWKARFWIF